MSRPLRLLAPGALLFTLSAGGATADDPRGTLALSGVLGLGSLDFKASRTFTEFVEEGRLHADYEAAARPGWEALLQYRFTRRLGVSLAFVLANRDDRATFEAAIPHPLYFDRPRRLGGERGDLAYRERTSHLDLVLVPLAGRLQASVFAGLSVFQVRAEVIDRIEYDQAYPFDDVTFRSAPSTTSRSNAIGFNVGGALDFRIATHLGLGALLRFSRARVELKPPGADTSRLDAGGPQAAAGLRVFF